MVAVVQMLEEMKSSVEPYTSIDQMFEDNADRAWTVSEVSRLQGYIAAAQYRWIFERLVRLGQELDPDLEPTMLTLEYLDSKLGRKILRQAKMAYAQNNGIPQRQATIFLIEAIVLAQFGSEILELLSCGEVTQQHITAFVSHIRSLSYEVKEEGISAEEIESQILVAREKLAENLTESAIRHPYIQDFLAAAKIKKEEADPRSLGQRSTQAARKRGIFFHNCTDGMGRLEAYLPAQHITLMQQVFATAVRSHRAAGTSQGRSGNQIMADVFVDLFASHPEMVRLLSATAFNADSAEEAPSEQHDAAADVKLPENVNVQLLLKVNFEEFVNLGGLLDETLLPRIQKHYPDLAERSKLNREARYKKTAKRRLIQRIDNSDQFVSELSDDYRLSPQASAALLDEVTKMTLVLTDPVTDHTIGTSTSSRTYRPTERLKLAVKLRDHHCRAPGCRVAHYMCETDHTCDWANNGATEYPNLALFCSTHHDSKTEQELLVMARPDLGDGVLEFSTRSDPDRKQVTFPQNPIASYMFERYREQEKEKENPPF